MTKPRVKTCCISSLEEAKLAIDFVKPFGLDLWNGVRTNGKLDEKKNGRIF